MAQDASIVGVVARLEPEKGHRTLLEAWPRVLARVPDAYLLVVGEGHLRPELELMAADLGIESRVVFAGRRDDIPAVTAALDVAVLPSYREAQGLVVLEAMALSRPIVATRVGGIPEMIEDGVSGLLVPPHDAPALADAIARLLLDHPLADTIARRGHDVVHDRFSVEFMVRAIEDLYDEGARVVRLRDAIAV
jgi:glycosyltransferase involved in cell wall biosynthesis